MLQALIENKLKEAFKCSFVPSEDSKTSSVFGLLNYLPEQLMWSIIQKSCGENKLIKKDAGVLTNIKFWPRWSANGVDISNKNYVEPDVFYEFENFNVIIEAKKNDNSGQIEQQWKNEISAYENEYNEIPKELYFIAVGGNETSQSKKIVVRGKERIIYFLSWQNLLNSVFKMKNKNIEKYQKRILIDVINAFEKHNFFCLEWLNQIKTNEISKESLNKINKWNFNKKKFIKKISENNITLKPKSIHTLLSWKIS